MRRSLSLVLALLAASPTAAQVRAIPAIVPPVAPAAAPSASIISALAATTPGPALSAPSLSVSPILNAPAPVMARAAIAQTDAALSAASEAGRDEAAVSRQAFDGAAERPSMPAPVAGREGAEHPALGAPHAAIVPALRGGIKTAVLETAEVAAITTPFALGALILRGTLSDPALLTPSMLGLWALGAWVMRDHLSRLRATMFIAWNASHDQKYRTDYVTGELRDIRGHEYGSDRYDEYADGPVGARAMALITLAAVAAAAASLLLGR